MFIASSVVAAGYSTVIYIVLPEIAAKRALVPPLIPALVEVVVLVLVVPPLCVFVKAVRNVHNEVVYKRCIELMFAWPHALAAPFIAVKSRALPRQFFGDGEPVEPSTSALVEQSISEQMSTKDWIDAYRAQQSVLADLKKQIEVQDTMSQALWDVAQEAHADGKVVKQDN